MPDKRLSNLENDICFLQKNLWTIKFLFILNHKFLQFGLKYCTENYAFGSEIISIGHCMKASNVAYHVTSTPQSW